MTSITIKKDGTTEIEYNDNKTIKLSPNTDIIVYKCPHLNCDKHFFSQDDLNQHRILMHGEISKNLTNLDQSNTKYFSRDAMYKLSGKIQRAHLKHMLLILGIDLKLLKRRLQKNKK